MINISIEKLDSLFQSYNYQVAKQSNTSLRIYTLRYGMYHAAELIKLNDSVDESSAKAEFSQLGYATEVKTFSSEEEIEEYLFEGFFIKTPLGNELKKRYKKFVSQQLRNLPEGSQYEYINSAYTKIFQDEEGFVIETENLIPENSILVQEINNLLLNTKGAIFIIIEAPAGFGKTCTAYEILNTFSAEECKKLPFFSELSRNREARIFKHILLNEIDEQFPIGIKKNIVLDQITKGRIPLIIDGFDELITRESTKEEVESMLTTIVELLNGEAKVIVTTRKTAMFSSEEFFRSIDSSRNKFSIARFEIKEPTLENWLPQDRIQLLQSKNFPLEYIENPVLLAYLRNISIQIFKSYLSQDAENSIADKYIDYLLKREQRRQNIKITAKEQLRIFRKLVRLMTEYNFTAESKGLIKDLIRDYNHRILVRSLDDYIPDERPSFDDLAETLSNHAFLDRKQGGNIGIVNDFIFGILVAENLILGKYEEYYSNYYEFIPQNFAIKAVQSYKIQTKEKKLDLWEAFNKDNKKFNYDVEFFFHIDYFFTKELKRGYSNLIIDGWYIEDLFFNNTSFHQSVFTQVIFKNCVFDLRIFTDCTFQNCTFNDCSLTPIDCKKNFNDFALFACHDNNGFLDKVEERIESAKQNQHVLNDYEILKTFFHQKKKKPIPRNISYLKSILSSYTPDQINKKISLLKRNKHIYFKDNICFISKEGVEYFDKLKKTLS